MNLYKKCIAEPYFVAPQKGSFKKNIKTNHDN